MVQDDPLFDTTGRRSCHGGDAARKSASSTTTTIFSLGRSGARSVRLGIDSTDGRRYALTVTNWRAS